MMTSAVALARMAAACRHSAWESAKGTGPMQHIAFRYSGPSCLPMLLAAYCHGRGHAVHAAPAQRVPQAILRAHK